MVASGTTPLMSMYVYACMHVYRIQQGWVVGYDCVEWETTILLNVLSVIPLPKVI